MLTNQGVQSNGGPAASVEGAAVDGTFTTFDPPGSGYTNPSSINPEGAITGYYEDASNALHGFLRARDGTITTFDPPGSVETVPTSINPAGTITGLYVDANAIHGFVLKKE